MRATTIEKGRRGLGQSPPQTPLALKHGGRKGSPRPVRGLQTPDKGRTNIPSKERELLKASPTSSMKREGAGEVRGRSQSLTSTYAGGAMILGIDDSRVYAPQGRELIFISCISAPAGLINQMNFFEAKELRNKELERIIRKLVKARIRRSQMMLEINNKFYYTSDSRIVSAIAQLIERELQKNKYLFKRFRIYCCNMGLSERYIQALKSIVQVRWAIKYGAQIELIITPRGERAPTAQRLAAYFARDFKRRVLASKRL